MEWQDLFLILSFEKKVKEIIDGWKQIIDRWSYNVQRWCLNTVCNTLRADADKELKKDFSLETSVKGIDSLSAFLRVGN